MRASWNTSWTSSGTAARWWPSAVLDVPAPRVGVLGAAGVVVAGAATGRRPAQPVPGSLHAVDGATPPSIFISSATVSSPNSSPPRVAGSAGDTVVVAAAAAQTPHAVFAHFQ